MSSKIIAGTTSSTALNMSADTSGVLEIQTGATPTTAVYINGSQQVAINGASVAGALSVGSSTGSVGIALQPTNGTGVYAYFQADATNGYLASSSGTTGRKFVYSLSAPDNAMTLNSGGDLSIGTTGNIGQEKLTVVTATDNVAAFFRNSHATSADVVLGLWTDAAKDTSNTLLIGINNAQAGDGRVVVVYGNGNIQNINNSYGALSDAKLKENIVDATPKLDDLMKVKVRNYNLIGDTNKQIGVVAQELEEVFAGLVEESIDTDREGNILETTTKSVKYSVFVPMLIKAVQELNAKVTALEAQLGAKL